MMEPQTHDLSGVSQTAGRLMNREEGPQTFHRMPVGLTTTVEKINRVLAGVQAQIKHLRRHRINLGLVRAQLAGMEDKWRGE